MANSCKILPVVHLIMVLISFYQGDSAELKEKDDFRVTGPSHAIVAMVGEEALLTCQRLPKKTAVHTEVRWYHSEPSAPVIAYRDGAGMTEVQKEEYQGRVEWIEDGIAEGRVALKIHSIQASNNGQYWCRFQEGDYYSETSLLLKVAGLGSAPRIHMEGPVGGGVQLVCTAKGWFPEPQVRWEDGQGEQLLSVSEHHIQDEHGLFYVEATLVVRDASAETVSCLIHNPVLSQDKASVIALSEKLQSEMASLTVIGPSQPILVRVGEDVELTCYLSPKVNAQNMEVRWVRSHRYPAVHVYVDGDHVAGEQMVEYRGRTALVGDAIHEGRLTLQIHGARTSDDGQYRCLFEIDDVYQEASMDLKVVGVGSSPLITMEGLKDGDMQLMCTSDGWFPQPLVQWMDRQGEAMPSFSEALSQDSRGLFHVETALLVTRSSIVNVTCSISNPLLGERKTASFSFSEHWQVIGPDSPMLALSGEDAEFPCFLSPEVTAEAMKVQFYRKELSSETIVYSHGEDLPSMQTPEYRKRTEFLNGSIAQGKVSVRLKNVTALDAGVYGCRFSIGIYDQIATWELRVSDMSEKSLEETQGNCANDSKTLIMDAVILGIELCILICILIYFICKCFIKRNQNGILCQTSDNTMENGNLMENNELQRQCDELQRHNEELQGEIDRRKAQYKSDWRKIALYPDWRKEEFQAVNMTLDAETAHPALFLSEQRRVTWQEVWQDLPDSPQRFHSLPCVLGQLSITSGRYYWEVDIGDTASCDLGICRDNVTRKGRVTISPQNGFWAIRLYEEEYWALTSPETLLTLRESPHRVGIFLDYEDGVVSFYNMTDGSHIFTFTQILFQGALRPLFRLWNSDSGTLTIVH